MGGLSACTGLDTRHGRRKQKLLGRVNLLIEKSVGGSDT
jgi:hypothetical protein